MKKFASTHLAERSKGQSILVVEDNVLAAQTIERLLKRKGHTVTCVRSILLANVALAAQEYDTIITDREVLDGDAWAWASDRHENVVYMSGSIHPEISEDSYYLKGTSLDKLLSLL